MFRLESNRVIQVFVQVRSRRKTLKPLSYAKMGAPCATVCRSLRLKTRAIGAMIVIGGPLLGREFRNIFHRLSPTVV